MSPPEPSRRRRRIWLGLGLAALLVVIAVAGLAYVTLKPEGDTFNPDVEFRPEPTQTAVPEDDDAATESPAEEQGEEDTFVWAHYGYSKDRRRYFPADLRPPYRRVWAETGRILLEFSPVLGGKRLFLLKNNAALYTLSKRTGKVLWKRHLGYLAAASPAYGNGVVYVTLLQRGKHGRAARGGKVMALNATTGKIKWSRDLASRSESSPLIDGNRLYFGAEDGSVYSLRLSDGSVVWKYRASGAVKGGLALANGKLYFGDYGGRVHAIRQSNGRRVWMTGAGGGAFGLRRGNFYSTPAVAYGRVYIGSTDGHVYSFSSDNGKLAWSKSTGGFVYASPAVAEVPGFAPTVYIGSYSGRFFALDARTGRVRWQHNGSGKISGAATVVGDIVYYANLSKKMTVGLGARTGRRVFQYGRGSFNPVVADDDTLYLTGYSSLYALEPMTKEQERRAAQKRRDARAATRSACRRKADQAHQNATAARRSYFRCIRRNDAQKR